MHTLIVVLIVFILAIIATLTPWRGSRLGEQTPAGLRDGLQSFRHLIRFVNNGTHMVNFWTDFWRESQGTRGLKSRIDDATFKVRMLQRYVAAQRVRPEDAAAVYELALEQYLFSLGGLLESSLCRIVPSLPHPFARRALKAHWQLCLRATNLCLDADEGQGLFL